MNIDSEGMQRAANRMSSAADDMNQAARNLDGAVDRMGRVFDQFSSDMASIMSRLEAVQYKANKS